MPVGRLKKIIISGIVLGNAVLWSTHSDVIKYIANDQPLVFSRYSLGRFNTMMIVLILSGAAVYLIWGNRTAVKHRVFAAAGVFMASAIGLGAIDLVARWAHVPSYYSPQQSGFQLTDNTYQVTIADVPGALRRYPRPSPGFPPIRCVVTMDARGFRNQTASDHYDIVAIGDSFTEGFYVSDAHPWPVVLSAASGRSIYNLGMSGTGPLAYLHAFNRIGRFLEPDIVICMLTEISDFKNGLSDEQLKKYRDKRDVSRAGHRRDLSFHKSTLAGRIKGYFQNAPVEILFSNFCKRYLTRIHLLGDVEEMETISWMPIRVRTDNGLQYYNFTPKQLMHFYMAKEDYLASPGWRTATFAIQEIQRACREANIRFVVAYAPSKIHIALPLVKRQLPQDRVAAFAALAYPSALPVSATFFKTLLSRLAVQEMVLERFCAENAIEFISTTRQLRDAIAHGDQPYFTYDSHWTPVGHQVVAKAIYQRLFADTGFGSEK